MKKPYEAHEIAYQKMRKQGIKQWGGKGSGTKGSFSYETKRFLKDVLSQPWAPKSGQVVEFGCGTGPIIRWICEQGFSGLGLEVSKTAIAMAKEQSAGLDVRFRKADVCNLKTTRLGKFDLVVDGHCYHCITDTDDRKAFLKTAYDFLNPGGVLVLLSMCTPLDKKTRSQALKGFILHEKVVYQPFEKNGYGDVRIFNGKPYLPGRYLDHWKNIIAEVNKAGFDSKLIRYNANNYKDAIGTLTVGAVKPEQ
jgi:SAM-dependent methyltransferase